MPNIVTDSLIAYWNTKQGVTGNRWENIAPATIGTLNGSILGATVQGDGMYFDGVDDKIYFSSHLLTTPDYTFEFWMKPDNGTYSSQYILSNGATNSSFVYRVSTGTFQYNFANLTSSSINTLKLSHVVMIFTTDENNDKYVETYIDGISYGVSRVFYNLTRDSNLDFTTWSIGGHPTSNSNMFKGFLNSIKIYNKPLTQSEIAQNLSAGVSIGLSNTPPSSPPLVKSINPSKRKISGINDSSQSIITIQFDKDVTEYVARLNGSSFDTGQVVHVGGAILANTNTYVIIDWDELDNEGENRINIYGKGSDGQWTPYSING